MPSVQYVHFTAASSESGECSVLEGHDMHEITPEYEVSLMMPLSSVANFHSTASRIGACSDAFTSAMTSLFDAYPAETPFSNNDELLPKVFFSVFCAISVVTQLFFFSDDAWPRAGGTF